MLAKMITESDVRDFLLMRIEDKATCHLCGKELAWYIKSSYHLNQIYAKDYIPST